MDQTSDPYTSGTWSQYGLNPNMHTRCGRKVMILFFLNINVIPFKIVPLGSYTPKETLFPLLVAALEVFHQLKY
jgi:hypothetical protein